MKPVVDAGPGIFGHGAAHLGLWAGGNPSGGPRILSAAEPPLHLAAAALGISLFYYLLFRCMHLSTTAIVLNSLVHGVATALLVPPRFGFTYVQTALLLANSLAELRRPPQQKDAYYALYALGVGVPVGFVGWMEALGCDAFVRSALGGHLVYDTSISLSILTYYAIVRAGLLDAPKPKSA
jgi:hypothetical protein